MTVEPFSMEFVGYRNFPQLEHKPNSMRKLILEEWMSLDGHVADRNGQLNFFTQLSPEQNTYSDRDQLAFLETVDTILLGRKTYELFVDFWPNANTQTEIIADKLNSLPKLVFSNTLAAAPWGQWPAATVINGDALEAIRALKQQAGKDMVLWGSISLAQALMQANLIDEYHVQLCPVVTGGGRPLFPNNIQLNRFSLASSKTYPTGTVLLQYKVG
jgi:dihydrofolate reductase